jgi:hypothetical protein
MAFFIVCLVQVKAQKWSIGPKINIGAGWISSHNLNENLNAQLLTNKELRQWHESISPGVNAGIGVSVAYNFNSNVALLAELTWNSTKSKINMDYSRNRVVNGDGDITTVASEAEIKSSGISIPILLKYSFSGEQGLYGIAGLQFSFLGTPTLESTETRTRDSYNNGFLDKTTLETRAISAPLNVFETHPVSLTLGLGYAIKKGNNSLLIDLRYNLPLTHSEMYTTSGVFEDNAFENNQIFSFPGKVQYEQNAPGFPLNDFKMSTVELSVAFILFNK